MSKIRLYGATSGYIELEAPAVASDSTVTLPNGPFDFEAGYRYVGTRYYTSDGTFAKADPFGDSSFDGAKLRAIKVRCQGAGGGGGGVSAHVHNSGGGGGGGVYAESFITDIAGLDASVTVTRGAGGAGGIGGAGPAAGGASSFGAIVSASGGSAGAPGFGDYTFGGTNLPITTGTGNLVITGQVGGRGQMQIFSTSPPTTPQGGAGAASHLGGTSSNAFNTNGQVGPGFGSGGGAASTVTATARNGGAGGNGIVIVDIFA